MWTRYSNKRVDLFTQIHRGLIVFLSFFLLIYLLQKSHISLLPFFCFDHRVVIYRGVYVCCSASLLLFFYAIFVLLITVHVEKHWSIYASSVAFQLCIVCGILCPFCWSTLISENNWCEKYRIALFLVPFMLISFQTDLFNRFSMSMNIHRLCISNFEKMYETYIV